MQPKRLRLLMPPSPSSPGSGSCSRSPGRCHRRTLNRHPRPSNHNSLARKNSLRLSNFSVPSFTSVFASRYLSPLRRQQSQMQSLQLCLSPRLQPIQRPNRFLALIFLVPPSALKLLLGPDLSQQAGLSSAHVFAAPLVRSRIAHRFSRPSRRPSSSSTRFQPALSKFAAQP